MTIKINTDKSLFIIMIITSIISLLWTIFIMTRGSEILPTAFKLAGSSQDVADIEEKALDFMNMTMLKPLWEGLWVGIFGLFIASGLKQRKKYAWKLGLFWGIMMICNATIQGGYEIIILGWSNVCLQTYIFLFLGLLVFSSHLIFKKKLKIVK